ncbi:uncharacterized protein MYCFIDRAFT_184243 [Pseudocercospora fijiensis CIRAD86]|uniref:Uncharacterized protein n=1 Tax=Pseudocercospora fijiensis (strain CIRAD86) TaxID=383855 RepID=M2YGS3_PSEFD|nr:uncharacterized protein MYCFIDRAFT_184243 [Pseudocercospora fijiensis CIRAD86]EME77010.1 hypothetical protein MYCFIDRAFT_184243 [Pseudocercospora fijiensis CIRAD86]
MHACLGLFFLPSPALHLNLQGYDTALPSTSIQPTKQRSRRSLERQGQAFLAAGACEGR